jgi:hypothetical protein
MVSINGYGFPLKVYGFPLQGYGFPLQSYGFSLQGYGFPLHGNFWQNFFSAEKLKNILEFFSKIHVQRSIIRQPKSTKF